MTIVALAAVIRSWRIPGWVGHCLAALGLVAASQAYLYAVLDGVLPTSCGLDATIWTWAAQMLGTGRTSQLAGLGRPLGYPLLVAAVSSLGVPAIQAAVLVSSAAWSVMLATAYAIGAHFGGFWLGLPLAGALLAFSMGNKLAVWSNAQGAFNALAGVCLLVCCAWTPRLSVLRCAVMGFMMSLLVLVREQGITLMPPAMLVLALLTWRERRSVGQVALRLGAFLGGALPLCLPALWWYGEISRASSKLDDLVYDVSRLLEARCWGDAHLTLGVSTRLHHSLPADLCSYPLFLARSFVVLNRELLPYFFVALLALGMALVLRRRLGPWLLWPAAYFLNMAPYLIFPLYHGYHSSYLVMPSLAIIAWGVSSLGAGQVGLRRLLLALAVGFPLAMGVLDRSLLYPVSAAAERCATSRHIAALRWLQANGAGAHGVMSTDPWFYRASLGGLQRVTAGSVEQAPGGACAVRPFLVYPTSAPVLVNAEALREWPWVERKRITGPNHEDLRVMQVQCGGPPGL